MRPHTVYRSRSKTDDHLGFQDWSARMRSKATSPAEQSSLLFYCAFVTSVHAKENWRQQRDCHIYIGLLVLCCNFMT